ncbi:MAG: large-conductance mechanosensitive channel protein MscL [Ruminococcus sp.]|nr:large-conductance mechanosensitive channel protein MscL [Ruminococcus sp.]
MIGEFKKFIARGNVIDMAVGVIVGSAFTAIVNSLVTDIITPLLGTVLAGINFENLKITIPWGGQPVITVGIFINAVINFLLTAVCVFILVKAINALTKKKETPPAPPKPSEEVLLLREIRDLLKEQQDVTEEK